MKNYLRTIVITLTIAMIIIPSQKADAQILEVIKAGVKKVIKAVDLKIQRLQNKTIWLQNAQKEIENTLSKLKLDEISDWADKQKEQYRQYYEELAKVKSIISYYKRIHNIADKQQRLVQEYSHAWGLLQQDSHFTTDEIVYMSKVYNGILDESMKNIDQIFLIVESFATTMSDAKRLELINTAADQIDGNYDDLKRFNNQNMILSLQRSKSDAEAQTVKLVYGLP